MSSERRGTYIYGLTQQQTEDLREAAAVLDFKISRGVGAGEEGSLGQLMTALADRYREQPDQVLHFLSLALGGRPWKLPSKYRSRIPIDDYSDAD